MNSLHHASESEANLSPFVEPFGLQGDDIIRCGYRSFEMNRELPHATTTTSIISTDHMELCITAKRKLNRS